MNRLAHIQPRQWLLVGLVLIATGVLTFLLRDLVRENIVLPMTYALWLGDLMLRSVPQALLLGVLIALCLVILLRSATKSNRVEPPPSYAPPASAQYHSRLLFWVRQLSRMEDSQFAVEKLAVELRNLTLRILSTQEHLTDDELIQAIKRGTLEIPAEVRDLILRPQDWMTANPPSEWQLFLRWLRRNKPQPPANDAQSAKLDAAIRYIESRVNSERITD